MEVLAAGEARRQRRRRPAARLHLPARRGLRLSPELLRTPLHELHVELGAKLVPFAGHAMPVEYAAGLRAEHLWTRTSAGLFDVSHMGQVRMRGAGLERALERALPLDFDAWRPGAQKYSFLLNEQGGIEDDVMLTRLEDEVAIVVNAACREKDLAWLERHCPDLERRVLDRALIALQGPRAAEVLAEAADLKFMAARHLRLRGIECLVSRSGYTGEDGFEISVAAADALRLAKALLAHPAVKPVGLGARDTLRLEAALPLYGQDIGPDTTPREAGLAWAIAPARREGGKKALGYPGAAGAGRAAKRLAGLMGLEAIPVRAGATLTDARGAAVGRVTSGTVSPSLGKPVMLGYVAPGIGVGASLQALVRDKPRPVEVVATPFVAKRYQR